MEIDREECLRLLGQSSVGRVGVTVRALPTVRMVDFRLADEHIVVDAAHDPALLDAINGQVVAFEVDNVDAAYDSRWSVVVTGRGFEIHDRGGELGITTELVSGHILNR